MSGSYRGEKGYRTILFFAPLPAIRRRTRLTKMATVLVEKGFHVQFFGWERFPGEQQKFRWQEATVSEKVILSGGGYSSTQARLYYPVWMFMVFWHVLLRGRKKEVFCLGWETAFPACLAAFFNGARVVFDDADRFSMIMTLPVPFRAVIQALERWTSKQCLIHLIPGMSRYDWRHDRMIVLRNSPTKADVNVAKLAQVAKIRTEFVVYVNGWIGQTRGAPVFLGAMRKIAKSGHPIKMHVAGRVDPGAGEDLLREPNVVYHGEIPQPDALALYLESDVVLTFYDPAIPINRYAESNKWGDCLALGTPFVINDEVITARAFVDAGVAWSVPYSDHHALTQLLIRLSKDEEEVAKAKQAFRPLKDTEFPYFDEQFWDILIKNGVVSDA